MRMNTMLLITDIECNYIIIIQKKIKVYFLKKKNLGSDLGDRTAVFAQEWKQHLWEPTKRKQLIQCVMTKGIPINSVFEEEIPFKKIQSLDLWRTHLDDVHHLMSQSPKKKKKKIISFQSKFNSLATNL